MSFGAHSAYPLRGAVAPFHFRLIAGGECPRLHILDLMSSTCPRPLNFEIILGFASAYRLGCPRQPIDLISRPGFDDRQRPFNYLLRYQSAGEAEVLERARADGDLDTDANPAAVARYVATLLQGMARAGFGGASRDESRGAAEMVLKFWLG